jgi:anti-sigma factor RsiW
MAADPEAPIGEDDLHGFVDGALEPARLAAVQRYLDGRPEEAARLRAFLAQRDALRAALEFKHAEPIPPRLRIANIRAARRGAALARWRVAAAALALLLVGGGLGWTGRGAFLPETAPVTALAPAPSAEARAPAEALARDTDLAGWLRRKLGEALMPPDLTGFGYALQAAAVVPGSDGPAAILRYADTAGAALTVWRRPTRDPVPRQLRCTDEPGGMLTYTWSDGRWLHAVTAALPRETLRPIALAVERDMQLPQPDALIAGIQRRPCDLALG